MHDECLKSLCFFLGTGRAVCCRMIDWKKGLELWNEKALKSKDFWRRNPGICYIDDSVSYAAVMLRCSDGGSFLVHDAANEKKFKFVLADSLLQANERPLLAGCKVHVTKNVKPEPNQMQGMIALANI